MLKRWIWLAMLLVALVAFVGCSDDDDDPTSPPPTTGTSFEVMVAAGKAYINDSAVCPGVLSAEILHDNLDDYTVIDIRAEGAYVAGHIPGAYHSSLGTLLDDLTAKAIPTDKPFVIACYSGQSAGHAKIAMEMMGYDDVYSLLFGMSSWHTSLDSWTGKCSNQATALAETDNNNGDLTVHAFPTLSEDAGTVVAERTAWMLQEGFKAKAYTDIVDNLDEYFVLNYFGEADYLGTGDAGIPGHITGSYQFTPYESLGDDQMLNNLPTDMPIVVYCWTGQHSSQITAYLNMLGYEAYSLKNGSNNLYWDVMTGHKWSAAQQHDYELEVGYGATPSFKAMADAGTAYVNDSAQCPGIITAVDLNDNLDDYTVIDIRALDAYDAGHIPGAFHSSLGTLLADMATIPADKPYAIACYSGQSAGHAKIALEMMGYGDVYTLLWGMSSWHTSLDSWTSKCSDQATAAAETDNNNGDLTLHAFPTLDGYTADTVVAARTAWMLEEGFKAKAYTDIVDNLEEYFILNYFGEADYEGTGGAGVPGHITGAFQYTPYASVGWNEMLANIPADMPVIVYCWTGQHSSQITAYLNMLGYDAYSLKNGSNNLYYDQLTGHKWGASHQNDFTLEPTPGS